LRSFSVSLSDQMFCIRRWSICSSALYDFWLSTGTIQENSSLLAMRVAEVIFCLVVVTNSRTAEQAAGHVARRGDAKAAEEMRGRQAGAHRRGEDSPERGQRTSNWIVASHGRSFS
jgi:hypothetical protein